MTRRAVTLGTLLVVTLLLWSCGSGDSGRSPETSTSDGDVALANIPTLSDLAATVTPEPASTLTATTATDPAVANSEAAADPATGGADLLADASGDPAAIERGKSLAQQCMACHSVDGSTLIGPTWQGLYGSTVTLGDGSTVTADAAYITQSVRDPGSQVVEGFPPSMPPFLNLSDQDIADIAAYIESLAD